MLSDLEVAVVPLLFLIVPAALALAAMFGLPILVERRRQNVYAAFCLTRGYEYVPSRSKAETQYAEVVGMFKIGSRHKWRDEISGVFNGRPFTAFEYQYVSGTGRFQSAYNKAMIHWRLDRPSLPHFTVVPASTYLFRIGRTPEDVDFPDDKAFSKAYILTGSDQAAMRSLFTPELRAALAAMPGLYVAAQAQDVFWWREGRLPGPDDFEAFLNEGDRVLNLFAGR
jgi:hypothetical protein